MYNREVFREWLRPRLSANSVNSYIAYLNAADRIFNVDEKFQELGSNGFKNWIDTEDFVSSFKNPSDIRSGLRKYLQFCTDAPSPNDNNNQDKAEIEPQLFRMEKQMQAAVRAQLSELEAGLEANDGGRETRVATGWIDIVAKDKDSKPVIIELKVDQCPESALTQVLGYAQDLEDERGENVRAYLIAGSFSDRTLAAARKATGLKLRTYDFSVSFNSPDQV